jgi:single-stranded-DNA-specific exonuclease
MTQPVETAGRFKEVLELPEPSSTARPSPPRPARSTVVRDPGEAGAEALLLARELGLCITAADALHRAGRRADDETRRFLSPLLAHLTPPDAMADRQAAAERIARAVRARERVCVFGDYDCDGITSTAVVTGILRALGGEVVPLLATRKEGGYGLSAPALARVLATGASLLITCDCGSSDHERLATARAAGVDVLVIDHHLVPAEPLPALAFLNPHRPDCGFPYKGLASCGLALSLGAAVRKELGAKLDLRAWLDLVAIGTVADVAPLTADNRVLVHAGLLSIARGARPGLRALAGHARIDLSQGLTAGDVAFRIAPRLNAPGRLADPDAALELLLTRDEPTAWALAASVEQITLERRALQERMVAEAVADIEAGGWARAPAILLARQGWHPGVVGIVAGRIASKYGRPTIVVALEGERGRGSVRGPGGFHLYDALGRCRDALAGFGGHQAAAGVEVRADRIEALREAWSAACERPGDDAAPTPPEADVRLDDRDDLATAAVDLERLEPCGEQNQAPRVLLRAARIVSCRDIKGHLKLEVAVARGAVGAFGYELGALLSPTHEQPLRPGDRVDLIGWLRRDTWRGGAAVELRIDRVVRAAG